MVFIKQGHRISSVDLHLNQTIEIISFNLNLNNNQLVAILACYRPPHSSNEKEFISCLEKNVSILDKQAADEIIIVGDLNFDMFDINKSKPLVEFSTSNGFSNTVKKGTRLNPITYALTLLDVILCYSLTLLIDSEVFHYPDSDHAFTVSIFNYSSPPSNKQTKYKSRCLNKDKLFEIKLLLSL